MHIISMDFVGVNGHRWDCGVAETMCMITLKSAPSRGAVNSSEEN